MRAETKTALQLLVSGLLVGVGWLAWRSAWFQLPFGSGSVTLFLGTVFCTAVLWAMLTLRSLANSLPHEPELDDGLTVAAACAWLVTLMPPRVSNFYAEGATDDFALAYLPTSLALVFVMQAAQLVWKRRGVPALWPRFFASLAAGSLLLGALVFFVAKGEAAGELFARSAVLTLISAGLAVATHRRAAAAK